MDHCYPVNKKGFTLFELLIVLAVIGLTSAIAIPSFSLSKSAGIQKKMDVIMNEASLEAIKSEFGLDIVFSDKGIQINETLHQYPEGLKMEKNQRKTIRIDNEGFFYPDTFELIENGSEVDCRINMTKIVIDREE